MDDATEMAIERTITRTLYTYARGVDRRDYDLIRSAYWEDGYDEHGEFSGPVPDYVAWLAEVLPHVETSTHQFTNVLIDVDPGGTTAESEAYCLNINAFAAADGRPAIHMVQGLRYLDSWECRNGEWRIRRRRCLTDWTRNDVVRG